MYSNNPSISPTAQSIDYTDSIQITNMFHSNPHSYSPASSSSAETNLVSPPQQYHSVMDYSDMMWSPCNNYALKRSNSVPPSHHQVKPLPIQIQKLPKEPSRTSPIDPETLRRQLDEKLANIDFNDITVAELKEILRERGLSASGRKAELLQRLKEEYDLVIHHHHTHIMLDRLQHKKSPRPTFSPYYTPRHASISIAQLKHHPLASSVPTQRQSYMEPLPFDICIKQKEPNLEGKKNREREDFSLDWHSQDYTSNYPYTKIEENTEVWDDQMLQNFLNQI